MWIKFLLLITQILLSQCTTQARFVTVLPHSAVSQSAAAPLCVPTDIY